MDMINKEGVKILIGVLIGSCFASFVVKFTHPVVWGAVLIIFILSLVIDWNKLNKKRIASNENIYQPPHHRPRH